MKVGHTPNSIKLGQEMLSFEAKIGENKENTKSPSQKNQRVASKAGEKFGNFRAFITALLYT